jgi:hypothetical protein
MFIELSNVMGGGIGTSAEADIILTQQRPLQIVDYLEQYWRIAAPGFPVPADPTMARPIALDALGVLPPPAGIPVHNIAYAMCLENTKLVDIMRRVVGEYRSGERLPPATAPTLRWLQVTEEVFFTSPMPFSVRSLASSLRPDPAAIRRNAYYRFLGMDLNHGTEDGRPYPYVKADMSNRDFSVVFESLLAETWKGFVNRNNAGTANPTDDNAIMELVRRLQEMLNARRQAGNLAREEFDAVTTLSWFFLTIAYNTQVVANLNATAAGVADRLRLIGERVGLAPHPRADSYLQLATPMSVILRAIEQNAIPAAGGAGSLYQTAGAFQPYMLQIITHWSAATGRNLKDATAAQNAGGVLQATAPGAVRAASATNGAGSARIATAPQ